MTPGQALVDVGTRHPRLARATVGWLALAAGVPIVRSDGRVWPYLVVLLGLTVVVAMVGARGRLGRRTLGGLSALGALHAVGGLAPGPGDAPFYDTWLVSGVLRYDQLVHGVGSAIVALAAFEVLGGLVDRERCSDRLRAWLAAGLTCGLGAANEVLEFVSAQRIPDLHVGDGANTGWDLVFNLGGVLAFVAFRRAFETGRRTAAVGVPLVLPER